ncbi:MAG: FAD binding domain-containing protein [Candidatus Omnitrophica bacterium]|nr:FAD binding domain-containing protein [Candidatus Omnitrophota bacterium]
MLLNPLTFHAPTSLSEAVRLMAELEHVRLHAGGTFLLNQLKLLKRNGARTPDHVITLQHIAELRGISLDRDGLRIGAMTTIAEIFDHPLVAEHLPVLKTVCRNISTQPIRNMATIGGNLTCRYTWTEMPAVSLGLRASLHFVDTAMNETAVDPQEFFAGQAKTDKLLTAVRFPLIADRRCAYRRAKKSQFVDIPMLSLIISAGRGKASLEDCRVAVNNCVEFAQRDAALEEFLNTTPAGPDLPAAALDHLTGEIYAKRGSDYKTHLFRLYLREAIEELINDE